MVLFVGVIMVHPVLFTIGEVEFYSYGLMIGIGLVLGLILASREMERRGMNPDEFFMFFILIIVCGIAGGRLFHVVLNKENYTNLISILDLRGGGLAIHGVLFGGLVAAIAYSIVKKIPPGTLLDPIVPSVALGQGFGRIGCFLNGCCYGIPTNSDWGVLTRYAPGLRHPYQLYESAANFLLFAGLMKLSRKTDSRGVVTLAYISGYSTIRFCLEFFRDSEKNLFGLSSAQILSVILLALSLLTYYFLVRKRPKKVLS
ncbi:MAG: prolipoprotein diacylglyceryl transferase [Firmicutes bacterium]|nr:prolipoprotein diacylglyceryl transferase [Candidatus Fermentithermobacillaceae bacterium]